MRVRHYRDAQAVAGSEPTVLLGLGQALEAAGELAEARKIAEQLVARAPRWLPALEWLAQLRWSAGEQDEFTEHYAAVAAGPPSPELYRSWCGLLAGVDQFERAAEVAASARRRPGKSPDFALLEAMHAGEAGDDERAEALFATLSANGPDRDVQEARHRLRTGDAALAENLDRPGDRRATREYFGLGPARHCLAVVGRWSA